MKLNIRQENKTDHDAVFELIERAFRTEELSDHKEHFLVERLRQSPAFVPELSIVAEVDDKVIGHILLTSITIDGVKSVESLALAPVSVLPHYQGQGIGSQLIRAAHEKAKALGFQSVVVLGHQDYYPRFGYQRADKFGISLPFDVPPENCFVLELVDGGLDGVEGVVVYDSTFGI